MLSCRDQSSQVSAYGGQRPTEEWNFAGPGTGNVLVSLQLSMLPGILEALPEGRGKGPVLLPVYPCPSVSGCLVCGECVCLLQWVPSQAAMWHLYVLFFFPCSPSCFPLCHLGSPLAASFSSLLLPFSQRTAALSPVYPMAYWRSQMPSTICPGCLHHTLS